VFIDSKASPTNGTVMTLQCTTPGANVIKLFTALIYTFSH
jgi:hypothetical protein